MKSRQGFSLGAIKRKRGSGERNPKPCRLQKWGNFLGLFGFVWFCHSFLRSFLGFLYCSFLAFLKLMFFSATSKVFKVFTYKRHHNKPVWFKHIRCLQSAPSQAAEPDAQLLGVCLELFGLGWRRPTESTWQTELKYLPWLWGVQVCGEKVLQVLQLGF